MPGSVRDESMVMDKTGKASALKQMNNYDNYSWQLG